MIPNAFEYLAPRNLKEAFALMERHGGDAKLLAGGHSLLPMMKLRLASPKVLIDLGRVSELAYIRAEGKQVVVGAMTTHAEIESSAVLRRRAPLLAEAAAEIGDVQVRNCGTMGGALAHADPAADYPAAVLALDAQVTVVSAKGKRTVPAAEFFVDMLTTALEPGEILTEVRFGSLGKGTGSAYFKLHQPASGFAIVGVAAKVELEDGKRCREARVGVTGVAPSPYRAQGVEEALAGKVLGPKRIADAAKQAAAGVEPLTDLHASARYRAAMAEVFTRRALTRAFQRAQGR